MILMLSCLPLVYATVELDESKVAVTFRPHFVYYLDNIISFAKHKKKKYRHYNTE